MITDYWVVSCVVKSVAREGYYADKVGTRFNMIKKGALTLFLICVSYPAVALCIVNRTQESVAFVRGEPFAGMETYFSGTVPPGGQVCARITSKNDGNYPVSIYSLQGTGRCTLVRGCFYDTEVEQIYFRGTGSAGCPIAFRDNTCN